MNRARKGPHTGDVGPCTCAPGLCSFRAPQPHSPKSAGLASPWSLQGPHPRSLCQTRVALDEAPRSPRGGPQLPPLLQPKGWVRQLDPRRRAPLGKLGPWPPGRCCLSIPPSNRLSSSLRPSFIFFWIVFSMRPQGAEWPAGGL